MTAKKETTSVGVEKAVGKNKEEKKKTRVLRGVVMSDKMKDTVVVAVTRYVKHPKYKKYVKRVKRYHAHDKGNTVAVGDSVHIQETKPISKKKRFTVVS